MSAANLFKLPENQKLQDSYTNTQKKSRHKEKHRERERERERGVILGRGRYGCKGVDDASEASRYRNGGE